MVSYVRPSWPHQEYRDLLAGVVLPVPLATRRFREERAAFERATYRETASPLCTPRLDSVEQNVDVGCDPSRTVVVLLLVLGVCQPDKLPHSHGLPPHD